MESTAKIIVHPGSWLGSKNRNEVLYGDYKKYLSEVKDATDSESAIIISNPKEDYYLGKIPNTGRFGRVPFKVPKQTKVINDMACGLSLLGTRELISTLKDRKIEDVDVCGEQLWWYPYGDAKLSNQLFLGCVIYYYNSLCKAGFSPKLRRDLCYPANDPLGFKGSFC